MWTCQDAFIYGRPLLEGWGGEGDVWKALDVMEDTELLELQ